MEKYLYILKKNGLTLTKFAKLAHLSRPTVYKYFEQYENGEHIKEPYKSLFDSFFNDEREILMESYYKCMNGNIIVKLLENTCMNKNGTIIKGAETRGKRDIVAGEIVESTNTNLKKTDIVYFSFYAGQPMVLDDEQVFIINYQDIKFIKRKGEVYKDN